MMVGKPRPKVKGKPQTRHPPRKALPLSVVEGDDADAAGKRTAHELTAPELAAFRIVGAVEHGAGLDEYMDTPGMLAALREQARAVNAGDLSRVEAMLWGQAVAMQALSVRLLERAVRQDLWMHLEGYMRLGMKAQAQSRQALETLAAVKQGPAVFARQANLSGGGPMQVNNGLPERTRARQTEKPPTQLLEGSSGEWVDAGTSGKASGRNPALATVGAKHRADDR